MIKSATLLEIIKIILNKEEILENDLNEIKDLTLNRLKLNGLPNDIDLSELKFFSNLKTLTLINFEIDRKCLENINKNQYLESIQFSKCNFKDILPINSSVKYLIIDNCKNIKYNIINNNKIVKIIDTTINLSEATQLRNTEELYLQKCQINNSLSLLNCNNLKYLNLDGSFIDDINVLKSLNIKVSYNQEYFPT